MRILVTGGAGFLGSHLCDKLISNGDNVICLDNLDSGKQDNIRHLSSSDKFSMIIGDVIDLPEIDYIDQIYNLASPTAPGDYNRNPDQTLLTNTVGVTNILKLAKKFDIPILQASTIRVKDNGKDNPYIQGKKTAEYILWTYSKAKIARLNSTFGPRMSSTDSRVIPAFSRKAMIGEDLIIYDNRKDRFCYVYDMIEEIISFMNSEEYGVKELGNPFELSILDLARLIKVITNSKSKIIIK